MWEGKNSLNVIRLVLASLVVLSHSWPLGTGSESGEIFLRLTNGQATGGMIAVSAFFAISGFLIAMSWQRCKWWGDYLRRRILRIHPGFIVAFGISVLLGILTTTVPAWKDAVGIKSTLWQALTLYPKEVPGAFGNNPYPNTANGSLWTIQYEFWCYLLIMLLGLVKLLKRWSVLILFGVCLGFLAIYPKGLATPDFYKNLIPIPLNGEWPRLLACFLSGTVLYLWRDKIPRNPWIFIGSAAALGVACSGGFWIVAPIAMTYAVFFLGFTPSWFTGKCERVDISYGVYLYAFPIQQSIVHFTGPLNPWVFFLVAMPPIILAGFLSYFLVERPFIRSRSKEKELSEPLTGIGVLEDGHEGHCREPLGLGKLDPTNGDDPHADPVT